MIEIVIDATDPATLELWRAVADLSERLPSGWVLIGGLMVQLHAIEHGVVDVRPTRDIDVLGQARPPGVLPAIEKSSAARASRSTTRTLTATGIATSAAGSWSMSWRLMESSRRRHSVAV